MVAMRIEYVAFVVVSSLGNHVHRVMILTFKTGLRRRGRPWSIFAVMADTARYAAIPVSIRRCFAFTGSLFLDSPAYVCPDDQQGENGCKAYKFFQHDKFTLLVNTPNNI